MCRYLFYVINKFFGPLDSSLNRLVVVWIEARLPLVPDGSRIPSRSLARDALHRYMVYGLRCYQVDAGASRAAPMRSVGMIKFCWPLGSEYKRGAFLGGYYRFRLARRVPFGKRPAGRPRQKEPKGLRPCIRPA